MLSRKPPARGQHAPSQQPAQPSVRPFELTYPGQDIASSPTNPFPQRPHEVWMGDQHVARKPIANPEQAAPTDTPAPELDWNRISLYAAGQTAPPSLVGREIQRSGVPNLQRDTGNQPETDGSAKGSQTGDDAELQAYLEKWKLPDNSNYQIRGNAIVIRRTWLLQDSAYNPAESNSYAPTAAAEILRTLRATGKLGWITDDIIAEAAPQITFLGTFPAKFPYKAFPISSTVYEIVGPPPTSNEITWKRHGGDGLTYIIHSHLFKKGDVNHLHAVAKRSIDALEGFTGLKVLPQYRDELVHILTQQLATAQQEGKKAVAQDVQRIHLEKVFGEAAWLGFVQQPPAESNSDAKEDAKGAKPFAPEVPPADQKFYQDFMKKHFGSAKPKDSADQPGRNVTPYLIAALKKLDQHPQKELILELMKGDGKKQGEELTAASIENAINAGEMKAAYKNLDIKVPETTNSDWKPVVKAPVKGEIVNRGGRLHAGESTEFAFEVRDRVDALRVPHLTVKWAATPQDNPTNHIETETCSHIDMPGEKPDYFDVTFDKPGLYTIHAFVYHNFYLPAHFSIPIEVKTEAQRMGELRHEAFAGMGGYQTQTHNFDTSWFNETFGDDKYDKGSKLTGTLPKDFKRRSFEERIQFIADERKRLDNLIKQYGSSSSPSHQEIARYATDYLASLETAEKTLNAESQAGRTFFDVRSTYLSRESGIPDKALHLVCSAKKDGNNVVVTLHDYTKLYEAVDYTFTGDGSTFAAALEDAFMDLCKAYPPGRVSLLAETLNDGDLTPAQSTLGFELDSGTAWKSLKSKVFSPVAQIAVNIVGAAIMIFAPVAAPVVFPMLVAYNATDTIDNLVQLEAKGNLTWESVAKGVAMIGLDLLPYVGRAKMFMKTGSKALYVIEGIEIAGQVAIMTSEGINQVEQLRNKDVREIAELEEEIQTLERTNPSHPDLAAKKADLNAKIQAAQDRSAQVFSTMAAQGGMMLVPGVVFSKLAAKGAALKADDLIATGLFEHRAGAQPHFDPATGKAYFDKATTTPEQLEALKAEVLKHQQASGQIEKPLGNENTPPSEKPTTPAEPAQPHQPGSQTEQPTGTEPAPAPAPMTPKPAQPVKTGSHMDDLAQNVQVPVFDGLNLGGKMQSGGDAGSLASHGSKFGVFEATLADGTPVVVKVYPKHKAGKFNEEVHALKGAQAAGGPKLYGLVYLDDTRVAVAMERIPGGFPTPVGGASAADLAEAAGYAAKVNPQTVQDVKTYGQRLWDEGYYASGEVQGFVDDAGNWRPIDVQGVKRRTGDPDELKRHQSNMNDQVTSLERIINERGGSNAPPTSSTPSSSNTTGGGPTSTGPTPTPGAAHPSQKLLTEGTRPETPTQIADRRRQVVAELTDPAKRQALIRGDRSEIRELLNKHGNWRELMEHLTQQADPDLLKIANQIFAHRNDILARLDQRFGAKIPGTASTELVSDVDLIVSGPNAGAKLIKAEAYMARHYGSDWSEKFRMNFYTEVQRLTRYEAVMGKLDDAGRAAMQNRMTELTEKFNFARMLHHAEGDPAAIARVENLIAQSGAGVNLNELKQISHNLTDPGTRTAKRNALLKDVDQDMAAMEKLAPDSPERVQLAQRISEKQIEANFYTEEAYIGPGAARMTVGGAKVTGHEAYQAMLSDLEMMEHIVHQANGDIVKAAREYELFKYVNRVTKAAQSGGQNNLPLTYFEHLSDYIYKRHRGAHKENAHQNQPAHLEDMTSDVPVTDEFLRGQFDWFMKEAYEVLPKLRQSATDNPAAWAPAYPKGNTPAAGGSPPVPTTTNPQHKAITGEIPSEGTTKHRLESEESSTHTPEQPAIAAPTQELLQELQAQGIKHNPAEIIRIARTADGNIVFLEKGTTKAGLQHIIDAHADDFARRGISQEQIPDLVIAAITNGKVVGSQGKGRKSGGGRPIYEVTFNGEKHYIAVSVGSNGFIVGANPAKAPGS